MAKRLICAVACLLVLTGCKNSCRSTRTTTVTIDAPTVEQVRVDQVQERVR